MEPQVSMVFEPQRKASDSNKKKNSKNAENKKDPYEEVIEILQSYDEGNKPRDLSDYEM